jgi:hypothetical protein
MAVNEIQNVSVSQEHYFLIVWRVIGEEYSMELKQILYMHIMENEIIIFSEYHILK